MTLAIDFGTSNTVIARWNRAAGIAETLKLPGLSRVVAGNPPVIPSLLYVQKRQPLALVLGQAVRDRGLDVASDQRFFRNFKRGIGASLQGFLPDIEGQPMRFEQVGQWFLGGLLETLRATQPLEEVIFTVPVDSFEVYRHWLGKVCAPLGIDRVRMLDEPTAAALGYSLVGSQTLLVVDFGGGTLDLSVVALRTPPQEKPLGFILRWGGRDLEASAQRPETAQVIAKAGENLGGADIDNWLADYFLRTQNIPVSPLTLRLAERLKIRLSTQTDAQEIYFNDETLETYELSLSRSHFEELLAEHQLFERLEQRLNQVLQQARRQGIAPDDIDAVMVVGGSAQIPAVKAWLQQRFGDRLRSENPFEAIAQGALQLSQVTLKDFLYHSYGVRYWNRRQQQHGWHTIIPQGQPYPMETPVELILGASVEKQPSIELVVGELGDSDSRTEVYFEGDRLITRQTSRGVQKAQPLNDHDGARTVAQLNPPGFPGSDRIRALFRVDSDRVLRLTVEDLLSGETLLANQVVAELS